VVAELFDGFEMKRYLFQLTVNIIHSFVCLCSRGPAYSGPQRWDLYIGPMRQPRERRGIGRCVQCMCTLCRVKEGTVGVSSLSGISKHAPSRRGLLVLIPCQPWPALLQRLADLATFVFFGSHVSTADILTLLIKSPAMVTVYRGYRKYKEN